MNLPQGGLPGQVLTLVAAGELGWTTPAGGSGITQLTGDVIAGPGSGSVAATTVQYQDGAGTFDRDGTIHGYLNSLYR